MLVAPFVVAVLLGCLQVVLVAWAQVEAADAARAGDRAGRVGADPRAAALKALPAALRGRVTAGAGGGVVVRVEPPAVVPGLDLHVVAGR